MLAVLQKLVVVCAVLTFYGECTVPNENRQVKAKMENVEMKKSPKLDVSFRIEGAELEVDYKVTNSTDSVIFLFNVLMSPGSLEQRAEQPFYTCLRSDGTLVLGKMVPPVPRIKSVELRLIPFATQLGPGATFSEKIRVPIPVEEYNPYFPKLNAEKVEKQRSERAVFVLQYVNQTEGLKVEKTAVENAYRLWDQNLLGMVQTISSNPVPLGADVNARTDTFERF